MPDSDSPKFNQRNLVNYEAWQDAEFKQQLQADPRAAVRALADKYQLDLPDINYRRPRTTQTPTPSCSRRARRVRPRKCSPRSRAT